MTTRPALSVSQRPAWEIVPAGVAAVATVVEVAVCAPFPLDEADECELHAAMASDAATAAATNVGRLPRIGPDRRW
jgi:hypothetical protein